MEEVEPTVIDDWWLAGSRRRCLVLANWLYNNLIFRNEEHWSKKEDDDSGLGDVGFEMPVRHHLKISRRQLVVQV
jgi:hypothetical protein